jgi:hypothetical protein
VLHQTKPDVHAFMHAYLYWNENGASRTAEISKHIELFKTVFSVAAFWKEADKCTKEKKRKQEGKKWDKLQPALYILKQRSIACPGSSAVCRKIWLRKRINGGQSPLGLQSCRWWWWRRWYWTKRHIWYAELGETSPIAYILNSLPAMCFNLVRAFEYLLVPSWPA